MLSAPGCGRLRGTRSPGGMARTGSTDQSHLIREVKRFAGLTPQRIRARESSLLTEITEGRVALRGQVSAMVSDS